MAGVTHFYGLIVVVMFPVSPNLIFSRNSVPFRTSEWAIPRHTEFRERCTLFRGITKTIPSLFRGIFSERDFDGNSNCHLVSRIRSPTLPPPPPRETIPSEKNDSIKIGIKVKNKQLSVPIWSRNFVEIYLKNALPHLLFILTVFSLTSGHDEEVILRWLCVWRVTARECTGLDSFQN